MQRRSFFGGAALAAVAAASVSKVAMAALPELVTSASPDTAPPLQPPTGRPYSPRDHAQRLDAALAHERGRQGIPPGGRAC